MAISPRRSSRSARPSQPASVPQQHTQSSASSVSSGRPDRNARSHQKLPSPRSSVLARSQSADDLEDSEKPQTRRTRSTQEDQKDEPMTTMDDEIDEEGEEEVTRCICGSQEYPGLPVASPDSSKKSDPNSSAISEDSTGWFIQCDDCKVWQHGGCVGIVDESTSPDEYFCEECRQELHKIMTNANGRKYSIFLPVLDSKSESASPEPRSHKAKENAKKQRDSRSARANAEIISKGRRPTMNSRDSKYDEDAEFLRALEESKKEALATTGTGSRKGKRSRSESEETNVDNKRQRTISGSSTKSKDRRQQVESDEEVEKEEKYKNIRGAAARNHKAKQERERGNIEKAGASSKRKGHNDKRIGDESDPSPEPPSRTTSSKGKPPIDNPFVPPPIPDLPAPKLSHHKKTGRPPAKRGRVGRNQYTKDRDPPSTENLNGISPARSHNSQEGAEPHLNGNSHQYESNGMGKPSRPRHMHPVRTTMNDMKKRVAGILEFISHQQVEVAGLDLNSSTKTSTSANSPPDANANANSVDLAKVTRNAIRDLDELDQEIFGSLNSKEMMVVLERRLMKWQQEYGKYGDK